MKTRMALLVLGAAIASPSAEAGCLDIKKLDNEYDNCLSNGKYVDAGISCFTGFEKQVKAQSDVTKKELGASNKKHVLGEKNSQSSGLAGSVSDYQIADATLDILIAAGKVAHKALDGYAKNIYYPEDFDAPPEVIGDPIAYLNNSPCYSEPRDMLKDMLKRTDGYIAELERAKKASAAMRDISHDRDDHLDQLSGVRSPASSTHAKGAGFKGKKSPNRDSSITGVDEDAQKQKK